MFTSIKRTKRLIALGISISTMALTQAQTIKYTGIEPTDNSYISTAEFVLNFDLSEVIEGLGGSPEEWGICCNGDPALINPAKEKSATLYKGTPTDGEMLEKQTITVRPNNEAFLVGNTYNISFPTIEIEPDQLYTLVITYDMYAGQVGATTWTKSTKYSFMSNPITLTYIGASEVAKVPQIIESTPSTDVKHKNISDFEIKFNYELSLSSNAKVVLYDGDTYIANASNICLDNNDQSILTGEFQNISLYNSHNYQLVIKGNSIGIKGSKEMYDTDISLEYEGGAYHMFGYKSVLPRPGMATLLEEIQVNFDFPEGYGFVYVDDTTHYPMSVYKGEATEENLLGTVDEETVTSDSRGLIYHPDFDFEAETSYTFVLEEDAVKAYQIGAARPTYLKDHKCERIELRFNTPAISEIPKVAFLLNEEPIAMEKLDGSLKIGVAPYEFAGMDLKLTKTGDEAVELHEVSANGAVRKIGDYRFSYLTNSGEQYLSLNTLTSSGPVDIELDADKEYRFAFPANYLKANQKLLAKHSGNEAFDYVIKGASATAFEVTYAISDGATLTATINKGSSAKFKIEAPQNWKVESVRFNGEAIETANGEWTTPAITGNSTVEVEYAYSGNIQFIDLTSSVNEEISLTGTDYTVSSDGEAIMVKNLKGNELVTVYTVSGLMVGQKTAELDSLKIELPSGLYIVSINNTTFKVKH